MLGSILKDTLTAVIKDSLEASKPPVVKEVALEKFDMGKKSIEILRVKAGDIKQKDPSIPIAPFDEQNSYQIDLDINYTGDLFVLIRAYLGSGAGGLSIPISISEVTFKGRLRIKIKFWPKPPYLAVFALAFRQPPYIDFSVKLGQVVDLLRAGAVGDWVKQAIRTVLEDIMVLPKELVIPMIDDPNAEIREDVEKKSHKEVQTSKIKGKSHAVAKQKKGLLRARLVRGENLPAKDVGGTSDPYCVFSVGDDTWQSKVRKKTINPKWDERFQFELVVGVPKLLACTVYDWDRVGKNDSMGPTTSVEFDKQLVPEVPKEVWMDLTKSGGRILVELTYYPDMMVSNK